MLVASLMRKELIIAEFREALNEYEKTGDYMKLRAQCTIFMAKCMVDEEGSVEQAIKYVEKHKEAIDTFQGISPPLEEDKG